MVFVLITILGDVDRIKLGLDFVTELGSWDGSFDCSYFGNLEGLLFGDLLGSTDSKASCCDEGVDIRSTHSNVLSTILVNVDVIIHGLDVGTELDSLDGSFDVSNDGNF